MGFRRSDNIPEIIYAHKYLETDVMSQITHMVIVLNKYSCTMAAADFGVGNMNNQELRKKWQGSNSQKLAVYQYVKASFYLKWDEANKKFILNRTASLNQLFFDLKNGKMLFPQSYANIKEHDVFNHIMAEQAEGSHTNLLLIMQVAMTFRLRFYTSKLFIYYV